MTAEELEILIASGEGEALEVKVAFAIPSSGRPAQAASVKSW